MAKTDSDLFHRLRDAGLRKQVAKTLSAVSDGANKKAVGAARSAISELRSLADELERRLPGTRSKSKSADKREVADAPATPRRSRPSGAAGSRTSGAAGSRASGAASSRARKPSTSDQSSPNTARAPRGQNKAKILESLKNGPKTAAEVARETGIGTGTVGTTLNKLAVTGEVVKAERGYGLPTAELSSANEAPSATEAPSANQTPAANEDPSASEAPTGDHAPSEREAPTGDPTAQVDPSGDA